MRAARPSRWMASVGMLALGLALATAARAQPLPRLPGEFVFPAKGSPGPVVFDHRSHVDLQRPNCTSCHPGLFSILKPGTPADGLAMGHKQMQRGKQCGACHNDKAAFASSGGTKCMTCHRAGAR
jgi:c(7)-type cytochrome triheme protein